MDARSKPNIDTFDEIVRAHEDAVLGALFLDPQITMTLERQGLKAWHFNRPVEQSVFSLVGDLVTTSGQVEVTAIWLEMRARGIASAEYDIAWIGSLASKANVSQALTYHCPELIRLAGLVACQRSLVAALDPHSDPAAIVSTLTQCVCQPVTGLTSIGLEQLVHEHPRLHDPVIDGLLRVGETANIIAPAKTGKSFLAGGLAWSVATGRPWLGRDVQQGHVLILDNELHQATLANRLNRIAYEMQIENQDRTGLDVISLRGKLTSVADLQYTVAVEPGQYRLVVIDALYRMLPQGTSENDNAQMMQVYNQLDTLADKWQSAIVVVHHSSKGNQGEKAVTDVGAGAGSIARAADSHIVLREHEAEGCHVLEARTRSWPSPAPVSVKYEYPLWHAVTLEPEIRKPARQNKSAQEETDKRAITVILEAIPQQPKAIQQSSLRSTLGFGVDRFNRLIGQLVKSGQIKQSRRRKREGKQTFVFYSKVANDSGNDSGNSSGNARPEQ
jgi:AAA domain/DnaB-like helicase N terminal domain